MDKSLTIKSKEGAATTTVQAPNPNSHVFRIVADDVTLNGFTVKGASGEHYTGIILYGSESDEVEHCNISHNNVTGNYYGIALQHSNSNKLVNNNASNNWVGIVLFYSSDNTILSNNLNSHTRQGILLSDSSNNNVILKNRAWNNYGAIDLVSSCNNNTISNNNANLNKPTEAISLWYSCNNNISSNTVSNNSGGIELHSSSDNIIENNTVSNNEEEGIFLDDSSNNTLIRNRIFGNAHNFGIIGLKFYARELRVSDYVNYIDPSNKVNGKAIYYLVSQQNKQIPSDAGFVGVINCTNIIVKDLSLTNNSHGVLFIYTNGSRIENVNASNNYRGIYLHHSNNNVVINNIASNNLGDGIDLLNSNSNTIMNNTISNNPKYYGIYLTGYSSNNTITKNTVSNNYEGIACAFENNTIYLNNFIGNKYNTRFYGRTNIWNSLDEIDYIYNEKTYKSHLGSYWSDYKGSDANSDGIGDTSYGIDSDKDNYPLMEPFENYLITPTPPENQLPVASFAFSPQKPVVYSNITFDASASYDADGKIVSYEWKFDDGNIVYGAIVPHSYLVDGDYNVTLTVTDNEGATVSTNMTVKVTKEWTFAIITDLHIGRGWHDYGADGDFDYYWNGTAHDGNEGNFNCLTDRLVDVVNWINKNYNEKTSNFW